MSPYPIYKLLFICIVFVAFSVQAQNKKNKPTGKDEDQIKSLIENETKAFFEIDKAVWENSWAHVPYAFWSFADTTDVNSFSGWDQIKKGFEEYFNTSKPSTAKITRDWHYIKVHENFAYVRFTQLVKDDNIRRPEQAEVRVLEKINNEWKIVCVTVIALQKDNVPVR